METIENEKLKELEKSRDDASEAIRFAECAAKFITCCELVKKFVDAGVKPDAKFEVCGTDKIVDAYYINSVFYIGCYEEFGLCQYFFIEHAYEDHYDDVWAMTETCHLNTCWSGKATLIEFNKDSELVNALHLGDGPNEDLSDDLPF